MRLILAFLSLASLAVAQDLTIFNLLIIRSGDERIHQRPIRAHGLFFWAGAPDTTTYCPLVPQTNCPPPTNVTYLVHGEGSTTAGLYTEVTSGQAVYVDGTTGAWQFTQAHSAGPAGQISQPFTYTEFAPHTGRLDIPGGAIACPEAGSYKIYGADYKTDDQSACLQVGLSAFSSDGEIAWQYV